MLERIEDIQGIGLLHHTNGKPHKCKQATLIYADNGRGKSTLATIFRSASTGNASLINACKTVDGTLVPKVVLQFGSGHKVTFENGTWSEQRPELLVFDADFIGRNVHSGGTVNTDHRKNLLEFALGEEAVAARAAVEKATADSKLAADKVQSVLGQISGYHQGLSIDQFEKLPHVSDIDPKVSELQKRLTAASNVAAILAKPVPKPLDEPSFDIDGLFDALALSLKNVHADAEKIVKQHVTKLGGKGAELWLSQGRQLGNGSECPYCDQDITKNDLISAYQTHFNAAYADLKDRIAKLQGMVVTDTSASIIDGIAKGVGVAIAQASAWTEHVPTQAISFDAAAADLALGIFRDFATDLVCRKHAAPAEPLGSGGEKLKAASLWEQVLAPVRAVNTAIKGAEGLVSNYKAQLSTDSVAQLQQQINQLQATKRRYDPKVLDLFVQIGTARASAEAADKAKKAARETLDSLMTTTLSKYQTSINSLLKNFGASFSIKGMSANFRGNAPRTEYGLLLRGRDVVLEGGPPSFATTLSEGDKRTLAFAFFVASTIHDSKLASRTVVVDDPMCSLDLNRRQHTIAVLKKVHLKAAQLIVFAHDPYFLRDLRDALHKEDKAAPIAIFQLGAAPNDYTDFAMLDLDKECESPYSQHHRLLNEFAGGNGGDPKSVAKLIRPMLEGYLHRRFPGLLPRDEMFGGVVVRIRDAVAPSPLCHAKNLVDELNEINDYVGQFHHDTDAVVLTASGLKNYVDRALAVVHKGAPI
ncbi:MAG: AAA family ATPase [Sulfuritalea sp.]|nr:AAA family ATPase [Sulfuritalea sp.]